MADAVCGQCGHRNPGGANFCSSCGAALAAGPEEHTMTLPVVEAPPATDTDVSVSVDDLPPGGAMLVVMRGPGAGSRFLMDKDVVTAGRHPESDVFLDDVTVSRRHAEVARAEAGGYVLRDVGSLNGTYLNRERIDAEVPLVTGAELQIGRFKLVFVTGA